MSINIEELKGFVRISDIISRFIPIKSAGSSKFKANCPFHHEKTPSFSINDSKGMFYCFGCNKGGDAIKFVQEYSSLSFIDAAQEVANISGVKLDVAQFDNPDQVREKKKAIEILEELTLAFSKEISRSRNSKKYLIGDRKLSVETIKFFRLGYFPKNFDSLLMRFENDLDTLIELGVFQRSASGKLYSKFSGRVIFPILNSKREVVAFAGRVIPSDFNNLSQKLQKITPKYYNSPESSVFKKKNTLYNYCNAKMSQSPIIVVEGYMDVISLHQAGVVSAVAQMGTALSDSHINMLWKGAKSPIFFLDGDGAGRRASMRAAELMIPMLKPGYSARFLDYSNVRAVAGGGASQVSFKDPDEFIQLQKGRSPEEILASILGGSVDMFNKIWIEYSRDVPAGNPDLIAKLEADLKRVCDKISSKEIARSYWHFFKDKIFSFRSRKQEGVGRTLGDSFSDRKTPKRTFGDFKAERASAFAVSTASELVDDTVDLEEILTLFTVKNPSIIHSDCWMENAIDIKSVALRDVIYGLESGAEIDLGIVRSLEAKYSGFRLAFEDSMGASQFYMKLYSKKLVGDIKQEINVAIKNRDTRKIAALQKELRDASARLLVA